jgi:hypothetical protein
MPRTNVVGTTTPPGGGAQRCAQAGEREHRTDSTAGTAATAAARMSVYDGINLEAVDYAGRSLGLFESVPAEADVLMQRVRS